jgi:predicted site-specific integrase-resolvase
VYQSSGKLTARFGISYTTLSTWLRNGRIEAITTPGGRHLYSVQSVEAALSCKQRSNDVERRNFIYARVSSAHQAPDLERQKKDLQSAYPSFELISDVGSGLNWKRPGFSRLLDLVLAGEVGRLVVAHRDRLCRFAFELLEQIMARFGTQLVVHGQAADVHEHDDGTKELADDLLAIVTYFTAKHNGLRSASNRRQRAKRAREEESENGEGSSSEDDESSSATHAGTARNSQPVAGHVPVDIQPGTSLPKRKRHQGQPQLEDAASSSGKQ